MTFLATTQSMTADAMAGTPTIRARPNLFAKLELFNPGGSHKMRAARRVVARAIQSGDLTPHGPRRIIEKSGGNFGVGLAYEASRHGIGVDLVIGLSFSPLKRALCQEYGARLIGVDLLRQGLQPKEVITKFLAEEPDLYYFTDQFSNPGNIEAHLQETGPELAAQLRPHLDQYKGCILVVAAGTGASASGVSQAMKARIPGLTVVLNQPQGCCYRTGVYSDHAQKGTAVGVAPPFLDLNALDRIETVSDADARLGQRLFAADTGIFPGPSAGGNYVLARRIAERCPDHLVATLIYDAGEGYLDAAKAA
ncbi:PLP-dependent cysteine synthase family protein [Alsobacter sp. SYSU BS001988]